MPRPIWTGSISFGLVNVPVKLVTATSPKDVRFHQLHDEDGARIQQKRVCSADGVEVGYEHIVKGYEMSPGRYVVVEPQELAGLDPEASHTIDLEEFVDLDQIDPVFFEKAYYLLPDKRAEKPYALLVEAMARSRKVGLARFVMRTKQYLAALRSKDNALVLSTMLFADEVVPLEGLEGLPEQDITLSEREVAMAEQLVASLATEFEPEKYHDDYRERVLALIEAKAEGQVVVAPPTSEAPTPVVDLMAALEASLAAAKAKAKPGGPPAGSAGSGGTAGGPPPRPEGEPVEEAQRESA
jgi:DNA end-binding protein Ku